MPITVSGTSITFNDATTQTTAGITSAVTSLNGQTGAITNTNLDSIGSYVTAIRSSDAPNIGPGGNSFSSTSVNSTIAGSTLRYNYTVGSQQDSSFYQGLAAGWFKGSGNPSPAYGGGGSALSGTWRCLGYEVRWGTEACGYSYYWYPGLWVRIS